MKRFFYIVFVKNKIIKTINHPVMGIVVPPLVALYYGTLDIWGTDWAWIANKKEVHEFVFSCMAVITALILFLKAISEGASGLVDRRYNQLMESMLVFFNTLVKKKKDRFFNKAKHVKPTGDIFKQITQPKDQIEHVLDGTKTFLVDGLGVDPKNIGITIIQGDPEKERWWYDFQCDTQKQHTKAKVLMREKSTAAYCYESGDSIFISDIRKGTKEGVFYTSDRSSKSSTGSIFCKPVRISVDSIEYVYIFTIAVFGQTLCAPYDEEECRACEKILDEIADRVELELYLHSMKQYRESGGRRS